MGSPDALRLLGMSRRGRVEGFQCAWHRSVRSSIQNAPLGIRGSLITAGLHNPNQRIVLTLVESDFWEFVAWMPHILLTITRFFQT